ncbi:ArnT family glycosyltransferase [Amycolatopsis australiensis]|uniref:Dolichyl-phosphate-mannose-protein mannosyltransferase n=1 Tax=Amycolatopsis australiensis TaxID=546364 RepID=A0A1K1RV63_9PSEU|nr:glycosyltransferase family 39 protein [Amycolatopsis australiensis]SFW75818.1 Dolichyl-phosphate-mannose-protein mannosyltransferase [Amycolatopsis australiensis]
MTLTSETTDSRPGRTRPAFARTPVLLIAGVTGVLLFAASRNYGFSFDEAYFVVAGRDHPAWGYFDQPPLLPFLAAGLDHLFPGSLTALRLPATLAAAGGIVLSALIARELGGRRVAQSVAAAAYAMSGATLICHYLATYSIDPFFWSLIGWLVVRWARQRRDGEADDRLLFAAGLVTAVSLQTKFLVPALWLAIAASSLVFGPRDLVRRPLLWAGALVATLTTVPTLVWQAGHGWPYLRMSEVVAAEFPGTGVFLLELLSGPGLVIGVPLALFGFARLLLARDLRPYRFLGVAFLLLLVAYLVTSGRSYYAYSLYAPLFAAGAVGLQDVKWPAAAKAAGWLLAAASVVQALFALPIYPRSWAERLPDVPLVPLTAKVFVQSDGQLGQLSDAVGQVYRSLPPQQRARTAIVTDSYAFAADLQLFGAERGLPAVYSPHRGYYFFGHPDERCDSVLFVGDPSPAVAGAFAHRQDVVPQLMTVFSGRKTSWDALWPRLRTQ